MKRQYVKFFSVQKRLQERYSKKLVTTIVDGFSRYTSKNLKDFICKSNKGRNVFLLLYEEQAIKRLSMV
ncbi:MAG TPA: hypothetical protein DEA58_01070 [Pseudothermotoga sp.]|nr:hypothetical protein [Pseudothermotoga sp.]